MSNNFLPPIDTLTIDEAREMLRDLACDAQLLQATTPSGKTWIVVRLQTEPENVLGRAKHWRAATLNAAKSMVTVDVNEFVEFWLLRKRFPNTMIRPNLGSLSLLPPPPHFCQLELNDGLYSL